jgi:hypothetical protein
MEKFPTTQEQRQRLLASGFVRVDGLKMFTPGKPPRSQNNAYTLKARPEWCGRCSVKNGTAVIYTAGGEIWLRIHDVTDKEDLAKITTLSLELCPHGPAPVFIPGTTGEHFSDREIFRRIANPDW